MGSKVILIFTANKTIQRTAHGSKPNSSHNVRYAQFVKMFTADPIHEQRRMARLNALQMKLNKKGLEHLVSDLGARLFGFKPFET